MAMKVGINCGSGQRPFTSTPEVKWINVDSVAHEGMPEPDLVCNGAHLPYATESVDYFVLHHVLEHFGCGEGEGLLREAYRVLRPGGSLLVFVPNLRALAGRWLGHEMDTQLFMTNVYGAYMGHEEDRHKWGFDPDHLCELILKCGRWDMRWFNGREISGAAIAMDWWILSVEAVRR